jgi:hypothetical protein
MTALPCRSSLIPTGNARRYLPALRCQRVAFSIFLCFFLRVSLRRFLMRAQSAIGSGEVFGLRPEPVASRRALRGVIALRRGSLLSATQAEHARVFGDSRPTAGQRKMLRRALAGLASQEVLVAAGVSPEARAEELDIEAWGRLAECATHSVRSPS